MDDLKTVNLNWLSLTVKLSCICHNFAGDIYEIIIVAASIMVVSMTYLLITGILNSLSFSRNYL